MDWRPAFVLPALLVGLTACGTPASSSQASPTMSPTHSPHGILFKMYSTPALKDAHFTITEQLPDGSGGTSHGTGDGVLVLHPAPAQSQSVQIGIGAGTTITVQSIGIGNTIYHRRTTDPVWTASPGQSELTNLDQAYELKLVGEELTPQGRAWRVSGTTRSGNAFEIWIRQKDNYPLKYASHRTDDSTAETVMFDLYNTGQTISPPPPAQVVQG